MTDEKKADEPTDDTRKRSSRKLVLPPDWKVVKRSSPKLQLPDDCKVYSKPGAITAIVGAPLRGAAKG